MRQIPFAFPALVVAGMLALSAATVTQAQDTGAAVDMTGMWIYSMEDAVKEAARETTRTSKSSAGSRATVRKQAAANLTFKPSPERRRQNIAQFIAKARASNPQAGTDLKQFFATNDVIGSVNKELVKIGLQPNNVADAYAVWWLNSWLASRSRHDTPPRAQIAAVRAQAVRALSNVPGIASASDATKQQIAESCLTQTVIIGTALEQAKNDPAQLKALAASVRQGAQTMGLDLSAMELTDNGFQKLR